MTFHYFVYAMLLLVPTCVAEICTNDECEYKFVIRRSRSMTYSTSRKAYNVELNGTSLQIVENSFRRKIDDDFIGSFLDADDVITTDGYRRDVITINDQFPGPTIEVMQGSQIVVHVHNLLPLEGTTIHWHGLYMRGTPWMDGAAYVTQCPILPHQKFTYRFEADPPGTHWYHSHFHGQRLDGLFGLLIIHQKPPILPSFAMSIIDWVHSDVSALDVQNPYGIVKVGTGEDEIHYLFRDYLPDNNEVTALRFDSGLINGRGRYNEMPYPLEEFRVTPGQQYRFRTVHAGTEYPFEVSIDEHNLTVVALDGHEVLPINVQSIMLLPGETVDFEMKATHQGGKFWFRANVPRRGPGPKPATDGIVVGANAIVSYQGTSVVEAEPTSEANTCSETSPCVVFNCPFEKYPIGWWKTCVSVAEARSQESQEHQNSYYGLDDDDVDVDEYFLNFAFPIGSSVNARKFSQPRTALNHPNKHDYITQCDDDVCDEDGCLCTHIQALPPNKTIQLVLMSYTPNWDFMSHHVVHLHGHSFAVLKVEFAEQNETSGYWTKQNQDILCTGDKPGLCTKPQWNGQRPSLNKKKPPIKDNVVVPSRGYAVIRFKTNNPGYWFLHCHQELHMIEGMSMVLNEAPGMQKMPPKGFPVCSDFTWTNEDYQKYKTGYYDMKPSTEYPQPENQTPAPGVKDTECKSDTNGGNTDNRISMDVNTAIGTAVGFVLLGAVLNCIPTIIFVCCRKRNGDPTF